MSGDLSDQDKTLAYRKSIVILTEFGLTLLEQVVWVVPQKLEDSGTKHLIDTALGSQFGTENDQICVYATTDSSQHHYATCTKQCDLPNTETCLLFPLPAVYSDSPISPEELEPTLDREENSLPVPVLPLIFSVCTSKTLTSTLAF